MFFFFKQKTAYEMRISDWSSDVCSSDLGAVVRLDGGRDPLGPRVLFVQLGSDGANLTGSSRAAQWMLLDQLIDEIRGRITLDSRMALLTPAGRETLARYIDGGGRVMVGVDRASDIRQLLRWSKRSEAL